MGWWSRLAKVLEPKEHTIFIYSYRRIVTSNVSCLAIKRILHYFNCLFCGVDQSIVIMFKVCP